MKNIKKGFTLIELLVVVLIIGILASVGVPYYSKTMETSKATDAVAIGHMLANAYRMFQLDNPGVNLNGSTLSDSCNSGACNPGDLSSCRILRCNYVAPQAWSNSSYNFSVGGGGTLAATARRNGGNAPYNGWSYSFTTSGRCSTIGSNTPSCPRF